MRSKSRIRKKIALKEGQGEVLDQKLYLESIISSMTDALIVVNPDATLRSVNKAALDLLGYKEDELIGQPLKKIFLQEEEEEEEEEEIFHKYFQKIIEAGVAYNIGLTFLTKQGKTIPVNFSGAVMKQEGKIVGVVGVARDMRQIMTVISDLEKKDRDLEERGKNLTRMQKAMLHMMGDLDIAKKEAEKAEKELKNLDQLKSDFVSTVSHELRTPLATMKEFTSILSDEIPGKLTKDQREYIDIIKGNIDRLTRLINNLLDISKIEADRVEFKRGLIKFASLVKQAAENFKAQAREKGLDLKIDVPQKPIDIYVDADKINQILTNLLNNALKFTEKGYIEISVKESKNEVECAVADTGRGIAKENLPKVFEKFQQFERTPGAGEKGTGLGLAITKDLIGMHSGRIWVESQLGKGTRFTFSLPKYTTEQLFKEYVNNGIKEAMKKGSQMSLMVVSIAEFERLKEELSGDQVQSILKDVEDVLKNSLRRSGDVAVKNTGEIVVLLDGCDKKNALSVEVRLKQVLEDYLARQNLAKKIELRFGCATYPDEANNHEELINKARQV